MQMHRLSASEFMDKATALFMKRRPSLNNIIFLQKAAERYKKMIKKEMDLKKNEIKWVDFYVDNATGICNENNKEGNGCKGE